MLRVIFAIGSLTLTACSADETVRGYGGADRVWVLNDLDGDALDTPATLEFPAPGRIAGLTPCARYAAQMAAPYPWFDVRQVELTQGTCPGTRRDRGFIAALTAMTQSEIAGDLLILRDEQGREMVFKASG